MGRCCNESDWYNFNNIKNNFYYLICKDYIVKFIVCISYTTQQYICEREREREREKVVYASIAFSSSRETFWVSWTWIRIELLFGGCEIETMTEVAEFANRNGRWRVLVDGFLEFGPSWKSHGCTQHPLDWKLWCTPLMASAINDDNPFFYLSYFVFLISCLQMLALDLQHHNTILVLAVWGGERSIYRHITRPFHHSLVLWDLKFTVFLSFSFTQVCMCIKY